MASMKFLTAIFSLALLSAALSAGPALDADSYNQWKDALKPGEATPVSRIQAPAGFAVERLRSAAAGEGSWVALAIDEAGRAIVSREDKGLLRFPADGTGGVEMIDDTLQEVRGLLFARGSLYAHANNSHALFRLRDADGDGKYEEVVKLRETPGGVGHGRDQLAQAPDGALWLMCGDDVKAPEGGFDKTSPFQHAADDAMLPAPWDKYNWSDAVHAPAGHVVRTDRDGKKWEIVCGGLRNPFGIAFAPNGEAFTYDADIEWDAGLPSYRPTRILHLVSGADYGWRGGSRALPAWMPDTAPAAVDIGKGSPTGCVHGAASRWPEPWKSCLFALDWAYGRIHAVTLKPQGASFTGTSRIFLEGRPLNVTSAVFGRDGQMYFTTGGRRTQSGFYRVKWTGETPPGAAPVEDAATIAARDLRRKLEALHGHADPGAVATAWPHLSSPDAWIRRAARCAIEAQPPAGWVEKAGAETNPAAAAEAALALARAGGKPGAQALHKRFLALEVAALPAAGQAVWLRALQIAHLREGAVLDPGIAARLESLFPRPAAEPNRLLCDLLAAAHSPSLIGKTLPLLREPRPQEERIHYLTTLGQFSPGWTLETRRQWLAAFIAIRTESTGGPAVPKHLDYLRAHFVSSLSPEEKAGLQSEIRDAELTAAVTAAPVAPRPFVRAWTIDDVLAETGKLTTPPDRAAGEQLFTAAGCAQCHRSGTVGGQLGPDLTAIGKRFDRRALVESVIEPWKVIAEQYRNVSVTLKSGAIHSGRLVSEEADVVVIATNPIEPTATTSFKRADIASALQLSAMPPGQLNTLTATEIASLLAWLESSR